jgi:hypothetical protein
LATDCLFCGVTENLVFHHVNPNEKNIDVVNTRSVKKANDEVAANKYYVWNESNYDADPATAWVLTTP